MIGVARVELYNAERIVILHDDAPGGVHRETHGDSTRTRAFVGPIAVERARQVRGSPLPIAPGIPLRLRAFRKEWQADRALSDLDLSGCRKHGL